MFQDSDNLCYLHCTTDEDGFPALQHFTDDGFGNLIQLSDANFWQLLAFRHGTKVI